MGKSCSYPMISEKVSLLPGSKFRIGSNNVRSNLRQHSKQFKKEEEEIKIWENQWPSGFVGDSTDPEVTGSIPIRPCSGGGGSLAHGVLSPIL